MVSSVVSVIIDFHCYTLCCIVWLPLCHATLHLYWISTFIWLARTFEISVCATGSKLLATFCCKKKKKKKKINCKLNTRNTINVFLNTVCYSNCHSVVAVTVIKWSSVVLIFYHTVHYAHYNYWMHSRLTTTLSSCICCTRCSLFIFHFFFRSFYFFFFSFCLKMPEKDFYVIIQNNGIFNYILMYKIY